MTTRLPTEIDCWENTNFLGLGKSSEKYAGHVLVALLLLALVRYVPWTKGSSWLHWVVAFMVLSLFVQAGFPNVIKDAQKCAKPSGGPDANRPWSDNSSFWFRDGFFLMLCVAALLYGLALFSSGSGSVADKMCCFDPAELLPSKANNNGALQILVRVACFLPLIGFLFYFVFIVVQKGELIKPVKSRQHWFERPLAIFFSLVFIPFLLYGIFGSALTNATWKGQSVGNKMLYGIKKLFSFRLFAAVMLFAVAYVFIWRLQGGLFVPGK